MKRETQHGTAHPTPTRSRLPMDSKGKSAATKDAAPDAAEDEFLAELGYKVRSSDMAAVAQKLEQMEMVLSIGGGATSLNDNGILSHLSAVTVHHNPSDISSWLESMLSELNIPPSLPPPPPPPPPPPQQQATLEPIAPAESSVTSVDFPRPNSRRPVDTDDLSAIIVPRASSSSTESEDSRRERKRARSPSPPPPPLQSKATVPVVLVDSQETGIRLVHALLGCAEAVQQDKPGTAEALLKQVGVLAMSQGGAMRKVATYFADALTHRIYRMHPPDDLALDAAFSDMLQPHFYETCPYLKFAHFTANQAILEALAGKHKVHIVDLSMKQGLQWPPLLQALALRPGGPPSFRLTGIGPPQPDNSDALQQVGWKLAQFAESLHVEFEYRGFVASSLADLEPYMLCSYAKDNEEAVAVNAVFELHRLLGQQGSIEKVLSMVKALRPNIVTMVEQEANHNGPTFLDRFTEALHYYSSMFDSLEGCGGGGNGQDHVMSEAYLGRQICNIVACDGPERSERHETAAQWRARMAGSGFSPVPLGSNAFKQASMLLELFAGGEGYRVEENDGCLMLGWHTRPLISTSAWRLSSSPPIPTGRSRRQQ